MLPRTNAIYDQPAHDIARAQVPRAEGSALVSAKRTAAGSALDDLRMAGCLKLLFSPNPSRVDGIAINSSGGLTSGDRITLHAEAKPGATLALTTQAAERAYRADAAPAKIRTHLKVAEDATLLWLPQELILFDGARLDRALTCDLAANAKALLVEPVVFGRHAMGEAIRALDFSDRITITRNGAPHYRDAVKLNGDAHSLLSRAAIAGGAGAMATVIYVAPDAEAHLARIQPSLPPTAGASLIRDGVLTLRAVARDGFALRQTLVPILDALTGDTLPKSWRL